MRRNLKDDKWGEKLLDNRPFAVVFVLSFFVTFLMEVFNRRFTLDVFRFIAEQPLTFLFNVLIVLLTLSVALLIPKRVFAVVFMSLLWLSMSMVNFVVLSFRTTPFSVIDFLLLTSVADIFTVYLRPWQMILIGLLILAAIGAMVMLCIKSPVLKKKPLKNVIAAFIVAALLLLSGNAAVEYGVVGDNYANLADAYQDYGFAYCFGRSIYDRGMEEPEDYSQKTVDEVLLNIREKSEKQPQIKPNILIVQLESFFDVKYREGLTFSEDPLPNFTALKAANSHGALTVPSISAGTINTEFEILTGMNLDYFGAGEYPYKTVLRDNACETAAYNLKELGYSTHAMHNNNGTFYDRHLIYPNLGFDTFTSMEYMEDISFNALDWAKDAVLTEEITAAVKATEGVDFVFAVSVQPHGKYPTEPFEEMGDIEVYGTLSKEEQVQWKYYVNQLHETDAFVKALTDEVQTWEEPTVVVFYGDHLPGLSLEETALSGMSLYQTEYVIWSNYDLGKTVIRDLNAFQLSAHVLELVGIEEGVFTKLHQRYEKNPNYREALELLQYDVLYGEKETYGGEEKYKPTNMKMGAEEIRITDVKQYFSTLYLYGMNFTAQSTVMIGGEEAETQFVSEHLLVVKNSAPQNGEEITVAQMDGNTVLSESEKFIVEAE